MRLSGARERSTGLVASPEACFYPGPQGSTCSREQTLSPMGLLRPQQVACHPGQVSQLTGVPVSWDQGSPWAEEPNPGKGQIGLASGPSHSERGSQLPEGSPRTVQEELRASRLPPQHQKRKPVASPLGQKTHDAGRATPAT